MKIYNTLEDLEEKIEILIKQSENQLIKPITGYEFYSKTYSSIFKDQMRLINELMPNISKP